MPERKRVQVPSKPTPERRAPKEVLLAPAEAGRKRLTNTGYPCPKCEQPICSWGAYWDKWNRKVWIRFFHLTPIKSKKGDKPCKLRVFPVVAALYLQLATLPDSEESRQALHARLRKLYKRYK